MHDQLILPDATNLNTHLRIGNVRGEERPLTDEELDVFFRTNYPFQMYPKRAEVWIR
jgi:hypothetical protein